MSKPELLNVRAALAHAAYLAVRDKAFDRAEFLKLAGLCFDLFRNADEMGVTETALAAVMRRA